VRPGKLSGEKVIGKANELRGNKLCSN